MPSTLTLWAAVGGELAARREQRREVEDEVDLVLGEQPVEQFACRECEPTNLVAHERRPIPAASGLRSSVTIGPVAAAASR